MVYNYDSLWLHLYTAYQRMILDRKFRGLDVREAFAHSTDGEECPIARCYKEAEFTQICGLAGFRTEYLGGYLSLWELDLMKKLYQRALQDARLANEHRVFLRNLTYDSAGYPLHEGKHAGVGGVYRLSL
jgi:hypothetical protein